MRRFLYALILSLLAVPAYAQQWDQVNGSMQVRSGPSAPLVIIDQTASGEKIISLRANGTEVCYATSSAFTCTGGFTFPTSCTGTYTGPFTNGTTSTGQCVNGTAVTTTTASAVTSTVPILAPNGSAAAPAVAGTGARADTGLVWSADSLLDISVDGVLNYRFIGGRVDLIGSGTIAWNGASIGSGVDTELTRLSANVMAPAAGDAYGLASAAFIRTAPTIASGGCTSPSISEANGTAAFTVTIGTSCTGVKTVTLTMPAADNLWACRGENNTSDAAQQTNYIVSRATSTTAVVLTSYDRVTGLQEDFTASDIYLVACVGSGS